MVGVPRSHGCLLCVRRRVRCDEGRPGCAKCATYGVDCPGYDRSLKFVAGKHPVRRRGHAKDAGPVADRASSAGISPSREADTCSSSSSSTTNRIVPIRTARNVGEAVDGVLSTLLASWVPSPPPHPRDGRAAYVNTVLGMINLDRAAKDALFYGTWFSHVPSRLGRKVTLDSAVCALAMHLLGKSRGDDNLVVCSRQLYGQSLVALQAALRHATEWRSSETLCTTMVLCLFELFADTTGASQGWMRHSSGVEQLIQHRGADGFAEPWDRAMLFSFRSIIIMNALFAGRDCFLIKKKWQRLLVSNLDGVAMPITVDFPASAIAMIDRHVVLLAWLPSVMRYVWVLRHARRNGQPVDPAHVAMLHRRASWLHAAFRAWYADAALLLGDPMYTEVPSSLPDDAPASPYATVLAYPKLWIASLYLSYAASMLVVQESLNQCAAVHAEMTAQAVEQAAMQMTTTTTTTAAATAAAAAPALASARHTGPSTDAETAAATPSIRSGSAHSVPVSHTLSPRSDARSVARAARSTDPCDVVAPQPSTVVRPYDASNRLLCRTIFRSFETVSTSLMGQAHLGFSMRVAYEFADVPTQLWTRALLERSVKMYASSRADTYPEPKPNEYNYN